MEELQIVDMRSGHLIESVPLSKPLHGLVMTPDGTVLLGMTPLPIDPATGQRVTDASGPNSGGEVLQIKVHAGALSLPKVESVVFSAGPCNIENEIAGARSIEKAHRLLQPLWTLQVVPLGDIRSSIEAKQAPKFTVSSVAEEPTVCNNSEAHGASFTMLDQTLWLDKYAELVQLDWTTGRVVKSLPTPRKQNVCSTPVPEAGGFISYQGDTVSFQSFESLSSSGAKKQIVEVKRGWRADDVTWPLGAEQPSRGFTVVWRAKPQTKPNRTRTNKGKRWTCGSAPMTWRASGVLVKLAPKRIAMTWANGSQVS